MIKRFPLLLPLVVPMLTGAALPPVTFTDLATPFQRVALSTAGQPEAVRVTAIRRVVEQRLPGLYPDDADTDRRIAKALADFPIQQAGYDRVVGDFPASLATAIQRFRKVFPEFTPPIPIYLIHSLGVRDGGTEDVQPGNRHIMVFGADTIARYHSDDSLDPFLAHELFHLEHARAFPDCDQFWCSLWQEGLAVDAADVMTPHATDHQLGLDVPSAIRRPTEAHWAEALCFVALHFDDTRDAVAAQALQAGGKPPAELPNRFGYYVGYRLARATGQPLPVLDRLSHEAARRLVRATLIRLMESATASCAAPAYDSVTTFHPPLSG